MNAKTDRRFRDDEDIKAELRRRGLNLAKIARDRDVPHSTLKMSFQGPSPKGDRIIAEVLGVEVQELWPERYDSLGRRVIDRSQSTTARTAPHRQIAKVA